MAIDLVVGIDFSDASRRALEHAAALATKLDGRLEVVHAFNPTSWAGVSPVEGLDWSSLIAEARAKLEEELARWVETARAAGADARGRFVDGSASSALLGISGRADLIVVGRRGGAELEHVLLGSVCERLVTGAACPVLVVPLRSERPPLPDRLLVGIDFSAASASALRESLRWQRALGGTQPVLVAFAGEADSATDSDLLEWARTQTGDDEPLAARFIEAEAVEGLPALAVSEGSDWIVLGVQGRTALASFLIGSTTHRVLKLTDRPVLAVPMAEVQPGEGSS